MSSAIGAFRSLQRPVNEPIAAELSPVKKRLLEITRIAVQALVPFVAGLLCAFLLPTALSPVVLPIVVIGVAFLAAFLYVPDFKSVVRRKEEDVESPESPLPREFAWDYESRVEVPPPSGARGIHRPPRVMNCWLIFLLQMLRRDERIWGWLRNPTADRPILGLEKSALFVRNYERAIFDGLPKVAGSSQSVRKEFSALNPQEISSDSRRQEDLFAGLGAIMNHDYLPEDCVTQILETTTYEEPDHLPRIAGGPDRVRTIRNWGSIEVALGHSDAPQPLQGLVDNFFVEEFLEGGVDLQGEDGSNHRYPVFRRTFTFQRAPEKLWILVKRFHKFGNELLKNHSPLAVEEEIQIPVLDARVPYVLDSIAIHHGPTLREGHYNGYIGNEFCDDGSITPANPETKQRDSQKAYVLLYSRRR